MPKVELFCYRQTERSNLHFGMRSRRSAIDFNFSDIPGKGIFAVQICFGESRSHIGSHQAILGDHSHVFWQLELKGCCCSASNRRTNFAKIAKCLSCPPESASLFQTRILTWHRPPKWDFFSFLWWTCKVSSRFLFWDLRRNGWNI
jgi:hypothetical protein